MDSNRDPAIDAPRIPSPEVYRSNSPSTSISPSRSPTRHSRNFSKSFDPLLRDLSPTSTLRAFTTSSDAANGKSGDQLFRSIASASVSERTFGARIAQTCKDIRAWCDELQRWEWPGSFAAPSEAEKVATAPEAEDAHAEFWGSLPRDIVMAYEKRVEEIRDALEELDVEHLKSYVLNAHVHIKSPQPGYDNTARTDYMSASLQHLDDFTALITATILQALPYLSRLNSLLNTWSIRVSVLRKLPGYLRELEQVKLDVEASWAAISRDLSAGQMEPGLLRTHFETIQGKLGKRIFQLGGRLDSVLDDLEGREETLPDDYIDAFETLEAAYGDWVMQTEREVMTQDLNLNLVQRKQETPLESNAPAPVGTTSSTNKPLGQEAALPVGLGVAIDGHDLANNTSSSVHGKHSDSPSIQAESPVLGSSNIGFGGANGESEPNSDPESLPPSGHNNTKELSKISTSQLPEVDLSKTSSSAYEQSSNPLSAPSPARSRHVPIVVGYDEKEVVSNTSATESTSASSFRNSPTLPEELPPKPSTNNVRNRAAFLNGGIEQTQTLQKSPSPVRPFEHASQAFTKLFQRANAAQYQNQHSRSTSGTSASSRGSGTGSLRRNFPSGNKKDVGGALQRSNTSMSSLQSINDTSALELEAPVSDADLSSKANRSSNPTRTVAPSARNASVTPETQYGFEPSTHESKSTIESAWNSPALSDFPDNWPLSAHMNDEEITSPKETIDANSFEKMFVDSLPASPNGSHQLHAHENNPLEVFNMQNNGRPLSKDRMLNNKAPTLDHNVPSPKQLLASSKLRNMPGLPRSDLSGENMLLSEASTPGSFQSNLSTPEVQSALAAGYFRPKEIETSPMSRTSSASTAKYDRNKVGLSSQTGIQRSPELEAQSRAKRASAASIESFSRSEVWYSHHLSLFSCTNIFEQLKTVDISEPSRSASFSSNSPISPTQSFPSPELARSPPRNIQTPVVRPSSKGRGGMSEKLDVSNSPPLNLAMPKRRLLVAEEPVVHTTTKHNQAVSGAEQLDRQVSRVLSSLPNRIRFTPAGSDLPTTPEPTRGNRRPSTALSSRTGLTLTAAQPDEKSRKSKSTDPEVKVYHLSKEGREQPIKLHVRLVGEGERVMVRVGGGWADLGDYLRQYAEHHGRRTISDGRFEVAGVNTSGGARGSSKVRTSLSRPGSVLDRPTSRLSQRRRSSLGFMVPFNSRSDSPTQEGDEEGAMTPTPPGTADASQGTPTSISTKSGSRPSTADAAYSSSPGSWSGAGLAGPANKKNGKELDQHKAQWVESMIERATKASVEKKKKTDEKTWGDIGKVGGTRRVIFKQPQKEG